MIGDDRCVCYGFTRIYIWVNLVKYTENRTYPGIPIEPTTSSIDIKDYETDTDPYGAKDVLAACGEERWLMEEVNKDGPM